MLSSHTAYVRFLDKINEFKDAKFERKPFAWSPLRRLKRKLFAWSPLRRLKRKPFAWSPIRRLMEISGATIVARDAVDELIDYLEDVAEDKAKKAIKLSRRAHRKKIIKEDMESAIKKKN